MSHQRTPDKAGIIEQGIVNASKKLSRDRQHHKPKLNVVVSEDYGSILKLARVHRRWAYEWYVTNSYKTIEGQIGKQLRQKEDKEPDIIVVYLTPEFISKYSGLTTMCFQAVAKLLHGKFKWKHIKTEYTWEIDVRQLSLWIVTPKLPPNPHKYRLFEVNDDNKFVRIKDQIVLNRHFNSVKKLESASNTEPPSS